MTTNPYSITPIRVGLISLGCAKNLVDAEVMLGSLMKDGFEITNEAEIADVLIVNTCSFIDAAQEESVDTILESSALRDARNREQGLVVSGCLPQRFREELPKLLPEVDAFMGIDQVAEVSEIVRRAFTHRAARLALANESGHSKLPSGSSRSGLLESARRGGKKQPSRPAAIPHESHAHESESEGHRHKASSLEPLVTIHARPKYVPDYETPRFRLTPRHFAYLKIAEGCNHPCSFCTIPRMRGAHRSRPQDDVIEEARRLIAQGVKELNLISQDSTFYGFDLRPNRHRSVASPKNFAAAALELPAGGATLCTLLRALNELPGDFWIRLLYTHPAHWTDELIQTIAECPKVARYVDMPLQHIHDNMLERMRRETSQQYIRDLIARIRAGVPGIALRTTFIVGFPGETETCFETLLRFIRETKFERLGVFAYSREEGTLAGKMMNQIPDRTKKRRRQRAMTEQRQVARQISEAFVGREIKVLTERMANEADLRKANVTSWEHGFIRTGEGPAPELNGAYLVARGQADAPDIDGRVYVRGRLPAGEFARVRVIGHTDYDLIAQPV